MNEFDDQFIKNPIIAAIRNDSDLEIVVKSNIKIVFVLYGSIMKIKDISDCLRENNKNFFIHIDLMEGLKSDECGIQFIKENINPSGIITTKQGLVKYAKKYSLYCILRLFIIDTQSLKTGIRNVVDFKPNAIEIMPGTSSKVICTFEKSVKLPIIAGGLVETKEEVLKSLNSGAIAISTTDRQIWKM